MHILDLPTEVLTYILSWNVMPYTMLVCKELYEIEQYLIPIKRKEIVERYSRFEYQYIGASDLIVMSQYEILRFVIHFHHRVGYIYADIVDVCLYGGERLALELLSMSDIDIYDNTLIQLSIIGGPVFWKALSVFNDNYSCYTTFLKILENAIEHGHMDIVEYIFCDTPLSIDDVPLNMVTGELLEIMLDGVDLGESYIIHLMEHASKSYDTDFIDTLLDRYDGNIMFLQYVIYELVEKTFLDDIDITMNICNSIKYIQQRYSTSSHR